MYDLSYEKVATTNLYGKKSPIVMRCYTLVKVILCVEVVTKYLLLQVIFIDIKSNTPGNVLLCVEFVKKDLLSQHIFVHMR